MYVCVRVGVRVCVETSLIAEAMDSLRPRLLPGETVDWRRTYALSSANLDWLSSSSISLASFRLRAGGAVLAALGVPKDYRNWPIVSLDKNRVG